MTEETFLLKRPLIVERTVVPGFFTIPAGASVMVLFGSGHGCIVNFDGTDYRSDILSVARVRATARCEHLETDSDYSDWSDVTYAWLRCEKFEGGNGDHANFCRGDKTRCPSSKVRTEARGSETNG